MDPMLDPVLGLPRDDPCDAEMGEAAGGQSGVYDPYPVASQKGLHNSGGGAEPPTGGSTTPQEAWGDGISPPWYKVAHPRRLLNETVAF